MTHDACISQLSESVHNRCRLAGRTSSCGRSRLDCHPSLPVVSCLCCAWGCSRTTPGGCVLGPCSVALRFVWRVCAVCFPGDGAHVRLSALRFQGRGGGGGLQGGGAGGGVGEGACWLADWASCCHGAYGSLRDNLASLEKPRLERHQSRPARVEEEEKDEKIEE